MTRLTLTFFAIKAALVTALDYYEYFVLTRDMRLEGASFPHAFLQRDHSTPTLAEQYTNDAQNATFEIEVPTGSPACEQLTATASSHHPSCNITEYNVGTDYFDVSFVASIDNSSTSGVCTDNGGFSCVASYVDTLPITLYDGDSIKIVYESSSAGTNYYEFLYLLKNASDDSTVDTLGQRGIAGTRGTDAELQFDIDQDARYYIRAYAAAFLFDSGNLELEAHNAILEILAHTAYTENSLTNCSTCCDAMEAFDDEEATSDFTRSGDGCYSGCAYVAQDEAELGEDYCNHADARTTASCMVGYNFLKDSPYMYTYDSISNTQLGKLYSCRAGILTPEYPTSSPTQSPTTPQPTRSPTTAMPSFSPSTPPTQSPTTPDPTTSPTTAMPSFSPSTAPTTSPQNTTLPTTTSLTAAEVAGIVIGSIVAFLAMVWLASVVYGITIASSTTTSANFITDIPNVVADFVK